MTDKARDGMKPVLEYGYNYKTNTSETLDAFRQAPDLTTKAQVAAGFVASNLSGDLGDRQDAIKYDPKGSALIYVNGIRTDPDTALQTTLNITAKTNIKTVKIENNTHAFGLGDTMQVLGHEVGLVDVTAIRAAGAMKQGIREKGEVFVIAHSQGAAITNSALKLLTPEERSKVHYQGFGGQTYIDANKQGLAEASNYRQTHDGVPYVGNSLKDLAKISPILAALPGNYEMSAILRRKDEQNWKILRDGDAKGLDIGNSLKFAWYHDMDRNYLNHVEKQWEKK
jgi:hypothetical protein